MKELSIEEKAKRYDEAIEIAKKINNEQRAQPFNVMTRVFPELAESEDERIRKVQLDYWRSVGGKEWYGVPVQETIAWLEKQGEPSIYDVPSRNIIFAVWELGNNWKELTNGCISTEHGTQLEYIQKHWNESEYYLREKQGEQKSIDKIEPKFKIGDFIVNDYCMGRIVKITNDAYLLDTEQGIPFSCHSTRLWDITKDAKDGDVLYINNTMSESIMIYKSSNNGIINKYASYNKFGFEGEHYLVLNDGYVIPATKEQRDLLFQKMKEAGYEWNAEKKELKKIEQKYTPIEQNVDNKKLQDIVIEEINKYGGNESYKAPWALDSTGVQYPFYFAKLGAKWQKEQKLAWSEEDEVKINRIVACLENLNVADNDILLKDVEWLKSLKDRIQPKPKQEWKQENIDDLTDFEIAMMHIGGSFFGEYQGLDPNDTFVVKEQAKILLEMAPKQEWSEEEIEKAAQEWDSKANFKPFYISPTGVKQDITTHKESFKAGVNWILKSLRPQNTWKPSKKQMERLKGIINSLPHQEVLYSLYQDLKKLREELL